MSARSPPRHRHDGTSPLPLGMDWSPPPGKWFYRVQVGIQSPNGITTIRGILRRFSDFLKLSAARRRTLEEWMGKLLSDIDISRSAPVASFIELEAAARSVTNKEMGFVDGDSVSGDIIKDDVLSGSRSEFMHETESELQSWHGRKPSLESIGSEISSVRESEISNVGTFNSVSDGPVWLGGGMENTTDDLGISDLHFLKDVQAVLPLHQRGKVKRVLMTFQRRLITAKADMEDLIARLNQEIAVKEFLMTKVKDLEGELDNARHKSRETLQQAVLLERERVTQLQWDLEELRRKVLETDENHKSEQAARVHAETRTQLAEADRERLEHEVGELKEKLQNLQKDRDSLETKAKADMKVLAKEVKLSRKSQPELKQQLNP